MNALLKHTDDTNNRYRKQNESLDQANIQAHNNIFLHYWL